VPSLRFISGPLEGEQIDVDRTLVLGRHDADVVIDDPELSRRHLEIRLDDGGLIIRDLDSTNGTLVDERPIEVPTHVRHGDRVTLGATVLEVQIAPDPGVTRLRPTSDDLDATRLRSVSAEASEPGAIASAPAAAPPTATAPPAATPPLAAPASPASGAGKLPEEMGVFKPPSVRRGGGLASRSWIPVVLSFGTVILTALALVIYFAQR
jgi:pSer/pThr/pTyr-binding forkhead associated (FHA) protein